ncbi:MAG: hypothetical protein FWH52_02940 [Synergistaceae bacterium]|nr:hypothetical protein [Synergistaceae bacterium]
MKVDSSSKTIFCTRCGSQLESEDAFVYFDLKHADKFDLDAVNSYELLLACGKSLLADQRYDQADLCFQKAADQKPDSYYIWKLRAFVWESKVVNEHKGSFYSYDRKSKELVENKEYIDRYKELCQTAVRHCPSDSSDELAEEFNDRIREHFAIAVRAYKEERNRQRYMAIVIALIIFCLIAFGLRSF